MSSARVAVLPVKSFPIVRSSSSWKSSCAFCQIRGLTYGQNLPFFSGVIKARTFCIVGTVADILREGVRLSRCREKFSRIVYHMTFVRVWLAASLLGLLLLLELVEGFAAGCFDVDV